MINLRFHIVSLVAVFLALALGIFVGSTLLDRATVDYLKASRERVDERNRRLRAENEALGAEAEAADRRDTAFAEDALGQLVVPGIEGRTVVVVATRGVDEGVVRSVATSIVTAGGRSGGVVWMDERTDLASDDTASSAGRAWGIDGDVDAVRRELPVAVAEEVAAAGRSATTTTTTTIAPPVDPAVTTTAPAAEAAGDEAASGADVIARLVEADLADWEDPSESDDGPLLDSAPLDVVVLVGEGAVVDADALMVPFVAALADADVRVAIGEVRRPRGIRDAAEAGDEPARGAFVEPFRSDDDLAESVVTVDNVDQPLGRVALLLALGELERVPAARYGEADSADRLFPEPAA